MAKMTDRYGVNGTAFNEFGHRCEPKPLWNVDDHVGETNNAFRGFSESRAAELVADFYRSHGVKPSKYYSPSPKKGMKGVGFSVPGVGFVFLDIIPESPVEKVE